MLEVLRTICRDNEDEGAEGNGAEAPTIQIGDESLNLEQLGEKYNSLQSDHTKIAQQNADYKRDADVRTYEADTSHSNRSTDSPSVQKQIDALKLEQATSREIAIIEADTTKIGNSEKTRGEVFIENRSDILKHAEEHGVYGTPTILLNSWIANNLGKILVDPTQKAKDTAAAQQRADASTETSGNRGTSVGADNDDLPKKGESYYQFYKRDTAKK